MELGELADLDAVVAHTLARLRPPPRLSLSAWADDHFRLSAESAAEPGRWKTLSYQRGIMDAITDPDVERVTIQKSARVGGTKMANAAIAFHMQHDPCPILVVQPTIDNAKIYSKEEIAPMLRDVEVLHGLVSDSDGGKSSANTVAHKTFPGGVLQMIGANSGRGFRMVSRRIVIFDEVDAYPPSAGNEGDPVKLGEKRSEYYWNRKLIAISTPLIAGASRIEELFSAGDRRRYYVPCPHCGHMDYLRFSAHGGEDAARGGHVMKWPKDKPSEAYFQCHACGASIEEHHKYEMLERGEWRPEPGHVGQAGHVSFHVWSAYSTSPNATWAKIVERFLEAKGDPEKLRTFVNTELGETWKERGEAPDWQRLYERREKYKIGSVPHGVLVLTEGVDVQKDRLVYEIVGWAPNKESWSVEAGEIYGDTALEAGEPHSPWTELERHLARSFDADDGRQLSIAQQAVDAGYNTQVVYAYARRHRAGQRVIATKGVSGPRPLFSQPSKVEVTTGGRRMQRGGRVWPVGADTAKAELYGWLGLPRGTGDPPAGYCHFPEYGEEFFRQLTAEHLVTVVNKKTRRATRAWHVLPNRENHFLDARILARVGAARLGIDKMSPAARARTVAPTARPAIEQAKKHDQDAQPTQTSAQAPRRAGGWLGGGPRGGRPRGGGWLGRRR